MFFPWVPPCKTGFYKPQQEGIWKGFEKKKKIVKKNGPRGLELFFLEWPQNSQEKKNVHWKKN